MGMGLMGILTGNDEWYFFDGFHWDLNGIEWYINGCSCILVLYELIVHEISWV